MDLDGDGIQDILSGSYSRHSQPMAGLFQVLKGRKGQTFESAAPLEGADGKPLVIRADRKHIVRAICTRPFAVDWDGDGVLDIITGNFEGTFYLFRGKAPGTFLPTPQQIMLGGKPLKINGQHSDPFVIDWDGDGDLDLLSGSSLGGVQWSENRAGPGKTPVLSAFETLIPVADKPWGTIGATEVPTKPSGATRIWVADVDRDGKLDILLGDRVTIRTPKPKQPQRASLEAARKAWDKEYMELLRKYRKAAGDADKIKKIRAELLELRKRRPDMPPKRRAAVKMTGFVWFYRQK